MNTMDIANKMVELCRLGNNMGARSCLRMLTYAATP
jgi:hypothetical protein